ncbi:alcohol dehydrogenase GroES-like domain-containing protein [Xylariales sp. AK1849]|nr:alcohol dehydrogenase GroES-like domain-containing protein [Xylariales sp. AK1849]
MASGVITPSEMRAAQLCEYNKSYELKTKEIPQIGDDELLVQIYAAGFCHSDLQVIHGQFGTTLPIIPSHEPAGRIVQVGARCVRQWKIGDRVGVLNFKKACSRCTGCILSKRKYGTLDPRFCETREMAGFKHDGAFAEYMVADPETTVKLPESVSFEQAAPLMCAGATVWGALEKAASGLRPEDKETIAIIGIGGLGHLAIQFSKALGYRTVAIDSRPEGRQLADEVSNAELVPDLVVDSTASNAAAKIFDFTHGEGVAATIVCTDSLTANEWALTLLRIGGTQVLLGLPPEKWRFDSDIIVFRELVLRGSYVASRESTERMMVVVERSKVESHLTTIPFEEVSGIVDAYQNKHFRGRLVVQIKQD